MATYTATAPNGVTYTFTAKTKPVAVRFLLNAPKPGSHWYDREVPGTGVTGKDFPYVVSTHKSVNAAETSFQAPAFRKLPATIVTDIREA